MRSKAPIVTEEVPPAGNPVWPGTAEFRSLAVQEPDRLDGGELDDFQNHFGRDGHAAFVVVPGADRNA